jgi:transcriptional regulator with XRE-family HTH domain
MTLGQLIRTAREKAGLTQAEVAERGGIRQKRISEIETGFSADPPLGTVAAIARGLKVPLWKLLKGLEERA